MSQARWLLFAWIVGAGCRSEAVRPGQSMAASAEPMSLSVRRTEVQGHSEVPPFSVIPRSQQMEKFPCTRCHTVATTLMRPVRPAAHWGVVIRHSKAETMNCLTCHADPEKGELRMLQGAGVGFDHAYKVCGQCHAVQERDWAGGAHGKRAVGWDQSRVALSCTGCHNPHSPAFEHRWPAQTGRRESME